MADEVPLEEYPTEIEEYLTEFHSSLDSVSNMVKTMVSVSRNELQQKLDPLEQAKLDLMSAYALNSLFWTYLVTQGMSPKEHGVKQELERIRTYMNKVREITDRKKAARLDKGAASRFLRSALWEAGKEKAGVAGKEKAGAAGKEKAGAAGKEKAGAAGKEKAGAAGKEKAGAAGKEKVGKDKAGTAPHSSQSAKRRKQS